MDAGVISQVAVQPVAPADAASFVDILYRAVRDGQWVIVAAVMVIGIVWAGRKWGGSLVPWFQSDRGGVVLAFTTSLLGALGTSALSGKWPGIADLQVALTVAMAAIGGYTGFKRIVWPKDSVIVADEPKPDGA